MYDDRIQRYFIGDDWELDEPLLAEDGTFLNLTGLTVGAAYLAPTGTTPAKTDLSSSTTVTNAATGLVKVIVSKTITALIPSLPAGRKRPLAHIQIYTIDGNSLKTTRRVISVLPIDPSAIDDRDQGDPDYQRSRGLGGGILIA